jgi:hypothetical protein
MLVAAPFILGGPAKADIIDLTAGGGGSVQIKFNNYESFGNLGPGGTLQVGSTNFGVFEVTSIVQNGGSLFSAPPLTGPGSTGDYIIGVFSGITVSSISGVSPNLNTGNSGGVFNFYEVTQAELSSGGFNPHNILSSVFGQGTGGYAAAGGGCTTNAQCYNGITNVGAADFLNFKLVPGANAAGDTLSVQLNTTSVPVTGSANGFGDITGGVGAPQFTTGTFTTGIGTKADVSFADEFCPNGSGGQCTPGVGNWSNESFDPASATVAAPEPGSVTLLGSALLALGFVGYLRRRSGRA